MTNALNLSFGQIKQNIRQNSNQAAGSLGTFTITTIATGLLYSAEWTAAALIISAVALTALGSFLYTVFVARQNTNPAPTLSVPPATLNSDQKINFSANELNDFSPALRDPNKQFVYNKLLAGRRIEQPLGFEKIDLSALGEFHSGKLFAANPLIVSERAGGFRYDPSTADTVHWTANFADSTLFGFCQGGLLAQDELQAAEHPGLAHLRAGLASRKLGYLDENQIALLSNVERFGNIDTDPPGKLSVYGNNFRSTRQQDLDGYIQRFDRPTISNIFAIVAPAISGLQGQPYQYQHLTQLFDRPYLAFRSMKERAANGQRVVAHTGNWGAGAFGNDPKTVALMQLAAARFAEVEILYYPMNSSQAFRDAAELLRQIESEHPDFTIEQFLQHVTANAERYNLRYNVGNGT